MPTDIVLALAGRISAGKTSLADALAQTLRWPRASFGDYVRAEAARRDLEPACETLQDLGARLIEDLGWDEFCACVIDHGGLGTLSVPCIVDGLRHVEAVDALARIFAPSRGLLVYLSVTDEERASRLRQIHVSEARGRAWERHSTERQVLDCLPVRADLTLTPEEATVTRVCEWLRSGEFRRPDASASHNER